MEKDCMIHIVIPTFQKDDNMKKVLKDDVAQSLH